LGINEHVRPKPDPAERKVVPWLARQVERKVERVADELDLLEVLGQNQQEKS